MDSVVLSNFIIVCEERSIARAADRLFMSKQALSVEIKKLEDEVGARLFIRTNAGVEVTPDGERLCQCAREILALWSACEKEIRSNQRHAELTVGFGYMSRNLWTKDVSLKFSAENPDIQLKEVYCYSKELLQKLNERQVDIVVTCMQLQHYPRYRVQALYRMTPQVIMTFDDPLANHAELKPEDLAGRLILYPESGVEYLNRFCQFMASRSVKVRAKTIQAGGFLSNLKIMRDENALLISNGVYRTIISGMCGYTAVPLVDESGEMPEIIINALMRSGDPENQAARRFNEFFSRVIAEQYHFGLPPV